MADSTEKVSESLAEQPFEGEHAAATSTAAASTPMCSTPDWQRAPGRWSAKEAELLILMRSKVLHMMTHDRLAPAAGQRAIPQQSCKTLLLSCQVARFIASPMLIL
jgi:hypothetical protein